jgi:hypothetical protein
MNRIKLLYIIILMVIIAPLASASYVIDNTTTTGLTSSNISLGNGTRWSGYAGGSIALNSRNDTDLSMNGLMGYYAFDEIQGISAYNINTESGLINTTNTCTFNGNATISYAAGQIGNAVNFDGIDDYYSCDGYLGIDTAPYTISFWMNVGKPGLNKEAPLFQASSAQARGLFIEINENGNTRYGKRNGTNDMSLFTADISNGWHMLTATGNSSSIYLYVDGMQVDSGVNVVIPTPDQAVFGKGDRSFTGTPAYVSGVVDETRIYNRVLSGAEIGTLYSTSLRQDATIYITYQATSLYNLPYRFRITHSLQNSLNNISLYNRQTGTSSYYLVQGNITTGTWYNIPDMYQYSSTDYLIHIQGNGSNTSFISSFEWDETTSQLTRIEAKIDATNMKTDALDDKIADVGALAVAGGMLGGAVAIGAWKRKRKGSSEQP